VKEVTYTPAQLAAREEGKLKHNAACCSQRPSFRIVCGAGNLAQCRILFATVIMQWPGPRRLSRNRRRNSFVLGPILPSGIGFCPGFWQRSVSDTRLHNSRREKYAALGNLARGRVAGGSFGPERVSAPVRRRLKALPRGDPGQDWLPHRLCRQFTLGKVSCVELKHAPPEVTYTPAQPATLAEGA